MRYRSEGGCGGGGEGREESEGKCMLRRGERGGREGDMRYEREGCCAGRNRRGRLRVVKGREWREHVERRRLRG